MTYTNPLWCLAAAGALASTASCAQGEPKLDAIRAATVRFQDVKVALAEGYVAAPECVTADMMGHPKEVGAMGVHYLRRDLLGITTPPDPRVNGTGTHTDFLKPAMLIYEPQADGSQQLVAVENLVFKKAWHAAGNKTPPSFDGVPYEMMADDPKTELDEAHKFEPHYDRHVWLYRDNPKGVYTPFNPEVTCENFKSAGHVGHNKTT